jgi:hypothetical protein
MQQYVLSPNAPLVRAASVRRSTTTPHRSVIPPQSMGEGSARESLRSVGR